jgi:hypothetical protein
MKKNALREKLTDGKQCFFLLQLNKIPLKLTKKCEFSLIINLYYHEKIKHGVI